MSLVEKLQSETSALLASVKAIVDTVATHGALLTETKNATTLTQNIVNLLTTGNGARRSASASRPASSGKGIFALAAPYPSLAPF